MKLYTKQKSLILSLVLFFAGSLASTIVIASSGQYFSDSTYQNPAELMLTILPTIDPSTGKKVTHNQRIMLAATNIWFWTSFSGISGPLGATSAGYVSANTYNPLVSLAYTGRLNNKWIFGLNIGHPIQAYSNLPSDSFIRFSGYKSDYEAVDISPSISYEINKKISLGAGFDSERLMSDLANQIPGIPGFFPESRFQLKTAGWGWGWHAGALYQPKLGTLLSLAYYSTIEMNHMTGESSLEGAIDAPIQSSVELPSIIRLKAEQFLNPQFGLIGRIDYTTWSTIQNVVVNNTQFGPVTIPFLYHNTFRYGLGAVYLPSLWAFTAGLTYEETPASASAQRVTQPGIDSWSLGLDAERTLTRNLKAAIGYYHQFNNSTGINALNNGIINQGLSHTAGNEVELRMTLLL